MGIKKKDKKVLPVGLSKSSLHFKSCLLFGLRCLSLGVRVAASEKQHFKPPLLCLYLPLWALPQDPELLNQGQALGMVRSGLNQNVTLSGYLGLETALSNAP